MSDSPPISANEHDTAEKCHPIQITLGKSRGFVVVNISKLVERLVLRPDEAEAIALSLLRHAYALRGQEQVKEVLDEPGP